MRRIPAPQRSGHGDPADRSPGLPRRLASLALLLVHLLVGLGASAADARALLDDIAAPHLESSADRPCAPAHDHATCEFCRLLGSLAGYTPPPAMPIPTSTMAPTASPMADASLRRTRSFTPLGPRAPPIAS